MKSNLQNLDRDGVIWKLIEKSYTEDEIILSIICFFSLEEKEQLDIIPYSTRKKYDFPTGDYVTDNPLEVYILAFEAILNSMSLNLICSEDDEDIQNYYQSEELIDSLFTVVNKITEQDWDDIANLKISITNWYSLRQLSQQLFQELNCVWKINKEIMQECLDWWIHP